MGLIELKGVSKRLKPRILTEDEFVALLNQLVQPYKTMVLLAGCTGLRVSEVLGLRWPSVDFERLVMLVTEGYVRSQTTKLKSEYSKDELPLDPDGAPFFWSGSGFVRKARGTGFSPAREPTGRTTRAPCAGRCCGRRRSGQRFQERSVGIRCVTAIARGSTKLEFHWAFSRS
jgi:Phage integrase family